MMIILLMKNTMVRQDRFSYSTDPASFHELIANRNSN